MKLSATYERVDGNGVKATRTLDIDHPHATCTAEYYNKVRPQLIAMNAMLNAQVLYDVKPVTPPHAAKKKPVEKKNTVKPLLQANAETKLKNAQN